MKKFIQNMSIKTKSLLVVIIAITILTTILTSLYITYMKSHISKAEVAFHNQLINSSTTIIEDLKKFYINRANANLTFAGVLDAIKAEDRERLHKIVLSRWELLKKENSHLSLMTFFNKDGEVFLRMSKKDKFGDKSANRKIISNVINSKLIESGFDIDEVVAFRVVVPIIKDGEYIGALEIGVDISYIVDRILKNLNITQAFLFKSDVNNKNYILNREFGKKLSDTIINNLSFTTKKEILKDNGNSYIVHKFMLRDCENSDILGLLFLQDITADELELTYMIEYSTILSIFLIIIISIALNFAFNILIKKVENRNIYVRTIMDSQPNIIVITNGKKALDCNKRFLEFTNYQSLLEFSQVHRCICEFFKQEEGYLYEDKQNEDENWLIKLKALEVAKVKMYDVNLKEDRVFLVQFKAFPTLVDEYIVVFTDITEQEILVEKSAIIHSLFDVANIGIAILNSKKEIIDVNIEFCKIYEYKEYELINRDINTIIYHNDINNFLVQNNLERFRIKIDTVKKSGDILEVYLACNRVILPNGDYVMIVTITDLTELKMLESRQKEQEAMLIQQSKMASMGEMIGAIGHQWKQPINILGLILQDILDTYQFNEMNEKYLKDIVDRGLAQIDFMSDTIDDFRNFFKPNKEKIKFDVIKPIEDIIRILSIQFKNRSIKITIIRDENCEYTTTFGYPNEFKQVVLNLLNNSKDAFEEQNIRNKTITISILNIDSKLILKFRDNAGGISTEMLNKLFKPYSSSKGDKGTGIGLYMSQMIIEQNFKGKIGAINIDDGAEFEIELNIAI